MPATDGSPIDSVTLPRHPAAPQRPPFPMLAVLAPLVGAAVLFAITRSPMMIAFAALSPVIAIAGTIDGRLSARRHRSTESSAYRAARERFLADVTASHARERALLDGERPRAASLMTEKDHRARRWAAPAETFVPVRIGTGPVRSALPVSGAADSDEDRELLATCRMVDGAPVVVDTSGGIGVIAPPVVGRAFARGLIVQLAGAHPPGVLAIAAPPGDAYDWLDDYPHSSRPGAEPLLVCIIDDHPDAAQRADDVGVPAEISIAAQHAALQSGHPSGRGNATAVLALSEHVDGLPPGCRTVVEVGASGTLHVLTSSRTYDGLLGELITAYSAARFGDELAAAARSSGVTTGLPVPTSVAFGELNARDDVEPSEGLPALIGVDAMGPLTLDLVASGPHAIVTGTTGSGKSELLISWVLGMALRAAPSRVSFLLVDFKGGTAFRKLAHLPHTVGVVTDLGHGEAGRALKSLRAELRRREAALAALGVADVRDADGAVARLVIVVDEAAAMLAAFPELSALFSDLAARGRALGVHLILGTQRATGVLADALLANCALRLSLRLASDNDSMALLGTDAAARLPHTVPGRFVVAVDGRITTAQAASATVADVDAVAGVHPSSTRGSAPWLPALPERIPLTAFGSAPAGSIVLGALDDPERQVQERITYQPEESHLVVLGVRGSGRSGVLATIAGQWRSRVLWVPAGVEEAWDALEHAESLVRSGAVKPCLVLIDDLDALLARFDDEHRDAVLDRVGTLLLDGPRAGIAVVCTATVLPSGLRSVAGQFGERLILRQADRQEHVLAGAPAELYDEGAPPGRGVWHGLLAQIAVDDGAGVGAQLGEARVDETLEFPPGTITLVVSRAPGASLRRLRASVPDLNVVDLAEEAQRALGADSTGGPADGTLSVRGRGDATAIVGDPDAWQSHWPLLTRLRRNGPLVFDGCTLAEVRSILHSRVLPPAMTPGRVLVCGTDGTFGRAVMPG